jgi:hypothetical protein
MAVYVCHRDRRITNLAPPRRRAQIAISWPDDGAAFRFVSSGEALAQLHDVRPAALSGILLMTAPPRSPQRIPPPLVHCVNAPRL